jgi:hypothetical protein
MRRLIVGLFLPLILACAPIARPYRTRTIDNPMTPTDGMLEIGATVSHNRRTDPYDDTSTRLFGPRISYGLTDRLAYQGALGLAYAIFEEKPLDDRKPDRVSLRVSGGLNGIGYGTGRGAVFYPHAGLVLKRRLNRSFWTGINAYQSSTFETGASDPMTYFALRSATWLGWQATDHVFFSVGADAERKRVQKTSVPGVSRSFLVGGFVGMGCRPWRWFDLYVGADLDHIDDFVESESGQGSTPPGLLATKPYYTFGFTGAVGFQF